MKNVRCVECRRRKKLKWNQYCSKGIWDDINRYEAEETFHEIHKDRECTYFIKASKKYIQKNL